MIKTFFNHYKTQFIYSIYAIFIGILIGSIDAVFGGILIKITTFRSLHPKQLIPFLPFAGIAIIFLYQRYSKESLNGMSLVFKAAHGESDHLPKRLVPLIIFSTWLTHLFGGSAGREGVAVQIGATVSHSIGKKFKFLGNPRALLVIGMAAGFSGLFQTPLTATFFAIEVLVSGVMIYEVLLPSLIASYAASITSNFLGLEKFSVALNNPLHLEPSSLIKLILLGISFGIVGGSFATLLSYSKKLFSRIFNNALLKIFVTACILSVLFLLLHLGRYSGLGTNLIANSFDGGIIYSYDWVLKFLFTILTLAVGFQGGEVTPLFAIGATLGLVLGNFLGLPIMLTAALGYAAVFGSATNTIIAPILIGVEVFGPQNMIYFAIVCSFAFLFNGNKTIYTMQKRHDFFLD